MKLDTTGVQHLPGIQVVQLLNEVLEFLSTISVGDHLAVSFEQMPGKIMRIRRWRLMTSEDGSTEWLLEPIPDELPLQ